MLERRKEQKIETLKEAKSIILRLKKFFKELNLSESEIKKLFQECDLNLRESEKFGMEEMLEELGLQGCLIPGDSIDISDEGFKAMKEDPEYEKWVLEDLSKALSTPYPGWARSIGGSRYVVAHIGASKDDCRADGWHMGYENGKGASVWESKSKESFWSKRGDQKRIQAQTDKKITEKRALEKKWMQKIDMLMLF